MNTAPTLLDAKHDILSGTLKVLKKIVLYGPPGSGKTELAATIAASENILRIFWFDCDVSYETLVYSPRITDEMRAKITLFRLTGSNEYPLAAETMQKGFTSRKRKKLCYQHGRIDCKECRTPDKTMLWSLYDLTVDDVVVIDPGSRVAELLYALCKEENETENKQQYWGDFHEVMNDIQTALLDCPCNVVWVSHELDITRIKNKGTKFAEEVLLSTVPMCGSRNYSKKFTKDYGYKISTWVNGSTFKATVKPGENGKTIVGSRRPVDLYDREGQPSLVALFDATPASDVQESKDSSNLKPKLKVK